MIKRTFQLALSLLMALLVLTNVFTGVSLVADSFAQQDGTESPQGVSNPAKDSFVYRFEAASIKETDPREPAISASSDRANRGSFYAQRQTVRMLLATAFGMQEPRIQGGPSWIDSAWFNVMATSDEITAEKLKAFTPQQARPVKRRMIQTLLEERFELRTHNETKVLPVFALIVAKRGLQFGKGLYPCEQPAPDGSTMPKGEAEFVTACVKVSNIIDPLSRFAGRPVIDETGLPGKYQFRIHFAETTGRVAYPESQSQFSSPLPATGSSGPSFFVALEEQTGLKLVPRKAPVEVVVIDHVEHPSEN